MNEQKFLGKILIPGKPESEVDGVWMVVKNSEVFLDMGKKLLKGSSWPVLNGVFNEGRLYTLVRCQATRVQYENQDHSIRITVFNLVEGIHIRNVRKFRVKKVRTTSPALNSWVTSSQQVERDRNELIIPESEEVFSIHSKELSVSIRCNLEYAEARSNNQISIVRQCVLYFEADKSKYYADLSKIGMSLRRLIMFLTNGDPKAGSIRMTDMDDKEYPVLSTLKNLNEVEFMPTVEFDYDELKDHLNTIIEKWSSRIHLEPVLELIQEKHHDASLSNQGYFLNMCMAMESFHKKHYTDIQYVRVHDKLEKRDLIINEIKNPPLKKWFKNHSKFWDNPTLRERLFTFSVLIENVLKGNIEESVDGFIDKVVKTRNDISHTGVYSKYLSSEELLLYGKVLEFVIRIEILKELGFGVSPNSSILEDARNKLSSLIKLYNYQPRQVQAKG